MGLPEYTCIYLNWPQFTFIYLSLPIFTWIFLNFPEFTWIYLNLPEFTWFTWVIWVYLNEPELVWCYLNLPLYSHIGGSGYKHSHTHPDIFTIYRDPIGSNNKIFSKSQTKIFLHGWQPAFSYSFKWSSPQVEYKPLAMFWRPFILWTYFKLLCRL